MLTTSQAAAQLGVSVRRVQAMIRSGRLAAQQFGRDWSIRPEDIAAVSDRKPGRPKKPAEPSGRRRKSVRRKA